MKRLIIGLTLCLNPSLSLALQCAKPIEIMVTGFRPFGGNKTNGSMLVANALSKIANNDCVHYSTCELPVEYDLGAREAIRCFEKSRPAPLIVVSLGEGNCQLRIETKSNNDYEKPKAQTESVKSFV